MFYSILLIHLHTVKWLQVFLCITDNSIKRQSFVYKQLNDQSSISDNSIEHNSFVCTNQLIDRTLSRGPGRDGNEGLFCISQSPCITGATSSDAILRTLIGAGLTPSVEMQSVYSTSLANWAVSNWGNKYITK